MITVEDSCEASLCAAMASDSTKVGPPLGTMIGNVCVWDLRKLKDVVVPDGVERIGNRWFWGAAIESAEIPASVQEIGVDAFCICK